MLQSELLSRIEEIILIAVLELGDNAYGVTIRAYVEDALKRKCSIGAIYVPLERLAERGFLSYRDAEPTQERGGRSKRMYTVTAKGVTALREVQRLHESLWSNIANVIPAFN